MDSGNRKMILSLLGIGIVIGIIFSAIVGGTVHLIMALKSDTILSTQGTTVESEIVQSGKAESQTSHSGDTWQKDAVYQSGDEVQYANNIYQAKWWTQGDQPDINSETSPWKLIGEVERQKDNTEKDEKQMNTEMIKASGKNDKGYKVVGYYPDWELDKQDRIQYDVVTHIIYAFAIPNNDGTIKPLDHPENAKKLISDAHKNDVKVMIAVGGWSYNDQSLEPVFKEATNSDEKIATFVSEMMKLVKQYGFDGIDVDWEHPRYGDVTQKQYENLIVALGKELKKDDLLLTSAVLSGVSADGVVMYDAAVHTDTVLNTVDWLNVMAYDGGDGERHSSYDFAVNCANYWKVTRKMPADKVVLGVPFYGRPSWSTYDAILEANPNAHTTDISMINGMEAYYNGIATIQKKAKWAKENVGGTMIWELSQDTLDKEKSLLSAIGTVIK